MERMILRLSGEPPYNTGGSILMQQVWRRMVDWLEREYEGWDIHLELVVGTDDNPLEAQYLLSERWVSTIETPK